MKLAIGVAVLASGCCDEYGDSRCGASPTLEITAFDVTTRTGEDQSDADMYFCVRLRSTTLPACEILDTSADNFEEGRVEVFRVSFPAIAVGDLSRFWLENRGGAIFDNNEWEIVRLRVDAVLSDGTTTNLYWDGEIDCANTLDSGDNYFPRACSY